MPARTQLNRLHCTSRVAMTDVPVLSPDRCGSFEQWFTHSMSNKSADVFYTNTDCILLQLFYSESSMFFNWNARGSVSTHKRTEDTLNQTWKRTEIELCARLRFCHVVLLACLFLTVGYKYLGSIRPPTDGSRAWLQSTMKGCSP